MPVGAIFRIAAPFEFNFPAAYASCVTKLWFETAHIDRGVLTKEWAAGNYISSISRTPSGANAGGGNKTDRNPELRHDFDSLDLEIALATLPMDFNIYDIPGDVYRRAKEIVQKRKSIQRMVLITSCHTGSSITRAQQFSL